jgi:tyrosyl-tRNA synthetase
MAKVSEELQLRGFIHQHTGDSLGDILDGPTRTIYHGIDPSADSAHVGNMVIWMLLRHLADAGHKIIFLVGGGTGRIGDPKPDAERTLLDEVTIDANVASIKQQAQQLIGAGQNEVVFVNNNDWLGQVKLIEFLRDVGKHFTVNELLKKDAIASRLQTDVGLSYTEFAYPLLQGYDYLELNRQYGCDVQVGGSDQWGNMVAGVDLVRRKAAAEVHAITVPLVIDKATGKKFGKSEGNAVWLDPTKTSPYAFYQFWLNVSDESVVDLLKLYTTLPLEAVAKLQQQHQANPGARHAQRRLAEVVTALVHGEVLAAQAAHVSETLFGDGVIAELTEAEVTLLKTTAPCTSVVVGTSVVEAMVALGLATSKREARTFITGGAVLLDGEKVTDTECVVSSTPGTVHILKRGKKQFALLEITT